MKRKSRGNIGLGLLVIGKVYFIMSRNLKVIMLNHIKFVSLLTQQIPYNCSHQFLTARKQEVLRAMVLNSWAPWLWLISPLFLIRFLLVQNNVDLPKFSWQLCFVICFPSGKCLWFGHFFYKKGHFKIVKLIGTYVTK